MLEDLEKSKYLNSLRPNFLSNVRPGVPGQPPLPPPAGIGQTSFYYFHYLSVPDEQQKIYNFLVKY